MAGIKCTHCGARLKLPENFSKSKARCPKCGQVTRIRSETKQSDISPALPDDTAPVPPDPPQVTDEMTPSVHTSSSEAPSLNIDNRARRAVAPLSTKRGFFDNLLLLFDFKFEHYLTPWVIRVTWILVLFLAAIWILLSGLSSVITTASAIPDTGAESSGARETTWDSNWDPSYWDSRSEAGSDEAQFDAQAHQWRQFTSTLIWQIFRFLASLVIVCLGLLWWRVLLETLIVVFNIANTLGRIEAQRAGD